MPDYSWVNDPNFYTLLAFLRYHQRSDDRLAVYIAFPINLICVFLNVFFIVGVLSNKHLRKQTCYWFTVSLCVSSISISLIVLFHEIPSIIWGFLYTPLQSPRNLAASSIYFVFYLALFAHFVMLSINRLIETMFPRHYSKIFSMKTTPVFILLVYAVSVGFASTTFASCCFIYYYPFYYTMVFADLSEWQSVLYDYVYFAAFGIMAVCNSICIVLFLISQLGTLFGKARFTEESINRARLIVQNLVAGSVFFLTFMVWYITPHDFEDRPMIMLLNTLNICSNLCNPVIFFIFNPCQIWRGLDLFFCCGAAPRRNAVAASDMLAKNEKEAEADREKHQLDGKGGSTADIEAIGEDGNGEVVEEIEIRPDTGEIRPRTAKSLQDLQVLKNCVAEGGPSMQSEEVHEEHLEGRAQDEDEKRNNTGGSGISDEERDALEQTSEDTAAPKEEEEHAAEEAKEELEESEFPEEEVEEHVSQRVEEEPQEQNTDVVSRENEQQITKEEENEPDRPSSVSHVDVIESRSDQ